ncbi:Rhodanese-like protein [Metarhizium album ARSEF 1941]|uniref:Rhodanese-like protein n=1 Tax=Metarhizium album (strain ARSEF 1941) TaxID=1081103 RepID=A0A0B2X3D9_METAS|nr:Rhodanese-like protein [Metarhizium album ARSEF 1941]KHN99815.1 Rhodanese-like protein [Metarhizium album ARSEF 1941]
MPRPGPSGCFRNSPRPKWTPRLDTLDTLDIPDAHLNPSLAISSCAHSFFVRQNLMILSRLAVQKHSLSLVRTMTTMSSLQRMSAKSLSEKILAEKDTADTSYAIIDVRDDDHVGGHIKGSANIPSGQLEAMMPTLVRKLQDKKTVIFHCALSQQRGPSAALKYLRERDGLLGSPGGGKKIGTQQEVYVLDRGFVGWQQAYGSDERLTEGYVKDIWESC